MRAFIPELKKLPTRKVLLVRTVGEPSKVGQQAFKALYMTAYQTKFMRFRPKGKVMKIGMLAARWPNAHRAPKKKWVGLWGVEVSNFVKTKDLLFKHPTIKPKLAVWPGGPVAQILHVGAYSKEGPTIAILRRFISEKGYAITGPHEEEYLTRPTVKKPKTIIRYAVKRAVRKGKDW